MHETAVRKNDWNRGVASGSICPYRKCHLARTSLKSATFKKMKLGPVSVELIRWQVFQRHVTLHSDCLTCFWNEIAIRQPHGPETAFGEAGVASPTSSGCERGHFYLWPYALYTLAELVQRRDCGQELLGVRELDAIGVAAGTNFQQLLVVGGGFARLLGYFSSAPGTVQ